MYSFWISWVENSFWDSCEICRAFSIESSEILNPPWNAPYGTNLMKNYTHVFYSAWRIDRYSYDWSTIGKEYSLAQIRILRLRSALTAALQFTLTASQTRRPTPLQTRFVCCFPVSAYHVIYPDGGKKTLFLSISIKYLICSSVRVLWSTFRKIF